jgi:hypothetical protein
MTETENQNDLIIGFNIVISLLPSCPRRFLSPPNKPAGRRGALRVVFLV